MKRGIVLSELLLLVIVVAVGYIMCRAGWAWWNRPVEPPPQKCECKTVVVTVKKTNTVVVPTPKGPDVFDETEDAIERVCFDCKSRMWLGFRLNPARLFETPVKEEVWKAVSPGDKLEVFVPRRGPVAVPVERKYQKVNPDELSGSWF